MTKPGPPGDLRARVLAEVARTKAATRDEHRRRVAILAVTGVLATSAVFIATGGSSIGARPVELVAFTSGLGLLAACALTGVSVGPRGSMLGRPRSVLLVASVVLTPALTLVALVASALWPELGREEVPHGLDFWCAALTLGQGAIPLALFLLLRRGHDPVHPAIGGAALGATAGAWTAVMAQLRCPHAAPFHCIAAHVVPTLVFLVAGAVFGASLLKPRALSSGDR